MNCQGRVRKGNEGILQHLEPGLKVIVNLFLIDGSLADMENFDCNRTSDTTCPILLGLDAFGISF